MTFMDATRLEMDESNVDVPSRRKMRLGVVGVIAFVVVAVTVVGLRIESQKNLLSNSLLSPQQKEARPKTWSNNVVVDDTDGALELVANLKRKFGVDAEVVHLHEEGMVAADLTTYGPFSIRNLWNFYLRGDNAGNVNTQTYVGSYERWNFIYKSWGLYYIRNHRWSTRYLRTSGGVVSTVTTSTSGVQRSWLIIRYRTDNPIGSSFFGNSYALYCSWSDEFLRMGSSGTVESRNGPPSNAVKLYISSA